MARKFLLLWISIAAMAIAIVGGLNYWIDPYDIFGAPRIENMNSVKSEIRTKVRTAKKYQSIAAKPNAVIIGNSRPEMGLDPEHACWPAEARPVYSMTIPGFSPYQQFRYGQHAIAAGNVRLALIGLDIMDYLMGSPKNAHPIEWPQSSAEPLGLLVDPYGLPRKIFIWDRLNDYTKATLSLDTLIDSISTVTSQRSPDAATRTRLGFFPSDNYYNGLIRIEGQSVLFRHKNNEMVGRMAGAEQSIYVPGTNWSPSFEALEQFIAYSRQKEIQLILFINPYHADYMTLLYEAGLWPLFDDWKRRLTALIAEQGDIALWDFSDFDTHTTETLAESKPGDKTDKIVWFWEPSHYRRELGDKMLNRMLADHCPQFEPDPQFGRRLTPETIDRRLADVAANRDSYFRAHPDEVRKLSQLVERVRQKAPQ